jgi:hypothetical protein
MTVFFFSCLSSYCWIRDRSLDIRVGTLLDLLSFMVCVTLLEALSALAVVASLGIYPQFVSFTCIHYYYYYSRFAHHTFRLTQRNCFSPSSVVGQETRSGVVAMKCGSQKNAL